LSIQIPRGKKKKKKKKRKKRLSYDPWPKQELKKQIVELMPFLKGEDSLDPCRLELVTNKSYDS
jgi:hypothetical protein